MSRWTDHVMKGAVASIRPHHWNQKRFCSDGADSRWGMCTGWSFRSRHTDSIHLLERKYSARNILAKEHNGYDTIKHRHILWGFGIAQKLLEDMGLMYVAASLSQLSVSWVKQTFALLPESVCFNKREREVCFHIPVHFNQNFTHRNSLLLTLPISGCLWSQAEIASAACVRPSPETLDTFSNCVWVKNHLLATSRRFVTPAVSHVWRDSGMLVLFALYMPVLFIIIS